MDRDNNHIVLSGVLEDKPVPDHQVMGEMFYTCMLKVDRLSGVPDYLPLTVSYFLRNDRRGRDFICISDDLPHRLGTPSGKVQGHIAYALQPYTSIADSTIAVSDSELKAEYNKMKSFYKTPERRSITIHNSLHRRSNFNSYPITGNKRYCNFIHLSILH